MVREVTALAHEAGDDAVEGRALESEALLAGAESAEVLGRLGSGVLAELHGDFAERLCEKIQLVGTVLAIWGMRDRNKTYRRQQRLRKRPWG